MSGELRALHDLADRLGMQRSYTDSDGHRRRATTDALLGVARALGADVERPGDAPAALRRLHESAEQRIVEPVVVSFGRAPVRVPLRLPSPPPGVRVLARAEAAREETLLAPVRVQKGRDGCVLALPALPVGYHRLRIEIGSRVCETLLLRAPVRVPALPPAGTGMFLPLYALREEGDLGVGNYGGLGRLATWCGEVGGSALATLPLLATNLDEPLEFSPYSPLSRRFWNEVFLDVASVPEVEQDGKARAAFAAASARVRTGSADLVDYRASVELVREVLRPIARRIATDEGPRGKSFRAFREDGEVAAWSRFRAVLAARGEPWQQWPEPLRRGTFAPGSFDPDVATWHAFAQWLAEEQLAAAAEAARRAGVRLYLDLPLGVHASGFDTFRHRELFMGGCSAGAPPDPLFRKGQNWGFPPLHPEHQRRDGYRHLVDVLRHHMRHAGILRLDHVMGLHRLYCVPHGMEATDGVYVRYAPDELYAVVTLEAARAGCHVVGEDLGTVPPAVRTSMRKHGLSRLHVLQFAIDPGAAPPVHEAPVGSIACLDTHDTPTFAAFLAGADIELQRELSCLDEGGMAAARAGRERAVAALTLELQARGFAGPDPDAGELVTAASRLLAAGGSEMVLLNLEDLWLELRPQNVPGTWRQLPNWRRRCAVPFAALQVQPEYRQIVGAVVDTRTQETAVRKQAKKRPAGRKGTGAPATEPEALPKALTKAQPKAPPEAPPPSRELAPLVVDVAGRQRPSLLTADDLHLFNEGSHFRLYRHLGAHPLVHRGEKGTYFAVWAPNAERVSVIGDFNAWDAQAAPLQPRGSSGIWEGFVTAALAGAHYKYHIRSNTGFTVDKADPLAFGSELMPATASVVTDLAYEWGDAKWMRDRRAKNDLAAPISIYEVHVGSWRRDPAHPERLLGYRELAPLLVEHMQAMQFTHVELLPLTEHPFYGSWGYQTTGYFSASSRYGTPQDLMFLIDTLHQAGFGVILDWVPSHFPDDEAGLVYFDGTHLYEPADTRQARHPEWNSYVFDYGRNEVCSFLASSAMYWLDVFHVDGLRVDAVASMLYLDYARKPGEWTPNEHGGRENLQAVAFLRRLNQAIYDEYPDVQTIAEESTTWPMVSRPVHLGGLGFGLKWDMGWMHDALDYLHTDPVYRSYSHATITFRNLYAFHESFVLPLSHDEVVYGKGSLLGKMPGDEWQRFANLRLLLAMLFGNPGKKLLFMGGEFGQPAEWNHDKSLDWHVVAAERHGGLQRLVGDLNRLYRSRPALHRLDTSPDGFEWLDPHDFQQSCYTFLRKDRDGGRILVAWNCTPIPRHNYRVGVDEEGTWLEVLNTDAKIYGGGGQGNLGEVEAGPVRHLKRPCSLNLVLPPLAGVFLELQP
ncbi:MAG: 1,4-alpha-glucan branching protein GlgB [Planctomycetota bacterium]